MANSLVNLLYCELVSSLSLGLVTSLNRCKELLDRGAELTLENLILERFGCDNLNTLFCTLNIRQNIHPFPLFIRDPRTRPSERGCAHPFIHLCIISLFLSFCNRFFENISSFLQYFSAREYDVFFAFDVQKTCIFFLYMIYYTVLLDSYPYFTINILQIPEALNYEILCFDPGRHG